MDVLKARIGDHQEREREPALQSRGNGFNATRKLLRATVFGIASLALVACENAPEKKELDISDKITFGVGTVRVKNFNQTEGAAIYLKLTRKGVEDELRQIWKGILQQKAATFEQILKIPEAVEQLVEDDMKSVPPEGTTRIIAYKMMARNSMTKELILRGLNIVGAGVVGVLVANALPGVNLDITGVSQADAAADADAKAEADAYSKAIGGKASSPIHKK